MKKRKNYILPILTLFLLSVALIGTYLAGREESTDIRKEAAAADDKAPYVTLEADSRCLMISRTETMPESMTVKIGADEYIATLEDDYWYSCLDENMDNQLLNIEIWGSYQGESKQLGTHRAKWNTSSQMSFDNWIVEQTGSSSLLGIIENNLEGSLPPSFPFENTSDVESISLTGPSDETLNLIHKDQDNNDYYIYSSPFDSNSSPQQRTYNDGIEVLIGSSNESNLILAKPKKKKADLKITIARVNPSNPYPDQAITVLSSIQNAGQGDSGNFTVDLYLDGNFRGNYIITNLPSGIIQNWEKPITAPSKTGTHTITIKVDSNDEVDESNENNNEYSLDFTVQNAPCTKTCKEKEILTSDCRCQSVECTKDSHCTGFETCNLLINTCSCSKNVCQSPRIINSDCSACICPNGCKNNQIQLSDCSCRDKEEIDPQQRELEIEIIRPQDKQIFDQGEKVFFEAEVYFNNGDEVDEKEIVWESNIDKEIGKGKLVSSSDLRIGSHSITLSLNHEASSSIEIHVLSAEEITIYNETPAESEQISSKDVLISAFIFSPKAKVDNYKTKIYLNNDDITDRALVGESYIEYSPLPEEILGGNNEVTITTKNYKEQEAEKEWSFIYEEEEEEQESKDQQEGGFDVNMVFVIVGIILIGLIPVIILIIRAFIKKMKSRTPKSSGPIESKVEDAPTPVSPLG